MESIKDDTLTELNALSEGSKNLFPLQSFPKRVQEIVLSKNATDSQSIDFLGSSILFAASVGIGNGLQLRVHNGWVTGCQLWVALIGSRGINKTSPLTFALSPFVEIDEQHAKNHEKNLIEYELKLKAFKKDGDGENDTPPPKPQKKMHMVGDTTPETLKYIHSENLRGVGSYFDELLTWITNMGRYNGANEMASWLSWWSGQSIKVDRKDYSIFIKSAFLPVIGTLQDERLPLFMHDRIDNGAMDRMLFCRPEGLKSPKIKKGYQANPSIDIDYNAIITKLTRIDSEIIGRNGGSDTLVLEWEDNFEGDAYDTFIHWQNANANIIDVSENLERGIRAKMSQNVPRFALILHLLDYACGTEFKPKISKETVLKAIDLGTYFIECAEKCYSIATGKPIKDIEKSEIQKRIWDLSLEGKSKSDISVYFRLIFATIIFDLFKIFDISG